MRLAYCIKYVADMDKAIAFHRDTLGLTLKFSSPFWTEFDTGATTLALHAASDEHAAGSVQLGFGVEDLAAFYAARDEMGITFTTPPEQRFGASIARFLKHFQVRWTSPDDSENAAKQHPGAPVWIPSKPNAL